MNVTVTGGKAPYQFTWKDSLGNIKGYMPHLTGLCSNKYFITVKDSNNCTNTVWTYVGNGNGGNNGGGSTNPCANFGAYAATKAHNPSISANCNGAIKINLQGGAAPFTFVWKDSKGASIQANDSLTNACAGSYTITVSDSNNCVKTITAIVAIDSTVNNPNDPCASLNGFVVSKPHELRPGQSSCNGGATVNVQGGSAPFTFEWKNTAGAIIFTGDTIKDICNGNYTVKVKDSKGCNKLFSLVIGIDSSALAVCNSFVGTVVTKPHNPKQGTTGCNGGAAVNITGGQAPYHFEWRQFAGGTVIASVDTLKNVCPGTYYATVRDNQGCAKLFTAIVKQDTSVIVDPCASFNGTFSVKAHNSKQGTNCNGGAAVKINGGVGPFQIIWSATQTLSNPLSTLDSLKNVCSGNYFVKISDSKGCNKILSVFIPNDTTSVPNTNCAGFDATIVTKAHNTKQGTASCNGGAAVKPIGGQAPYTYIWKQTAASANALSTTDTLKNVCSGNYFVTVKDGKGCIKTLSAFVGLDTTLAPNYDPCLNSKLTTTFTKINTKSLSACDGNATIFVKSGNAPFIFDWKDAVGNKIGTSNQLNGLCPGNYSFAVTEKGGCTRVTNFSIAYDSVVANPCANFGGNVNTKPNVAVAPNCNGELVAVQFGGKAPFTYEWRQTSAGAILATKDTLKNACSGNYFVTIKDANNCIKTLNGMIINGTVANTNACANSTITATVFTTPSSSAAICNGSASITVAGGVAPFTFEWKNIYGGTIGNKPQVGGLCAGNYVATVKDSTGCMKSFTTTVLNDTTKIIDPCANTTLKANVAWIPNTDSINCNGFAQVKGIGGKTPYIFSWSNATGNNIGNTDKVTGLCAGGYSVSVTDANGCKNIVNGFIFQDTTKKVNPCADLKGYVTVKPSTFNCNGSLSAFVPSTITIGSSFAWYNAVGDSISTTSTINNLCPGNYAVVIKFANGCVKTINNYVFNDSIINVNPCINSDLKASLDVIPTGPNCTGAAKVMATGGYGKYSITWSKGTQNAAGGLDFTITNLCQGVIDVTVKDSSGCIVKASGYIPVAIDTIKPLNGYVTTANTSKDSLCDGKASVVAFGGKPPYYFNFDNGDTNSIDFGLCAGLHHVKIKDSRGDSLKLDFVIAAPAFVYTTSTLADSTITGSVFSDPVNNCVINYNEIDSAYITDVTFITNTTANVTWTVVYANDSIITLHTQYDVLYNAAGVFSFNLQLFCPTKAVGHYVNATDNYYIAKSTLGLTNVSIDKAFLVYPNPFNEALNINLPKDIHSTVVITDVLGKVVYTNNYTSKNISINVNHLNAGQYFVTVSNDLGTSTQKIVK